MNKSIMELENIITLHVTKLNWLQNEINSNPMDFNNNLEHQKTFNMLKGVLTGLQIATELIKINQQLHCNN